MGGKKVALQAYYDLKQARPGSIEPRETALFQAKYLILMAGLPRFETETSAM